MVSGCTSLVSCLVSAFIYISESNGWEHSCCGEYIAADCREAFTVKWMGKGNVYVLVGECILLNFSVKRMGARFLW